MTLLKGEKMTETGLYNLCWRGNLQERYPLDDQFEKRKHVYENIILKLVLRE
jgi:hypothetical protein